MPTVFVISAPSGTGKTSLSSRLVSEHPNVQISVNLTSRPIRPGEIEGVSYKFVTKNEFQEALKKNEMLEHEEVFGNLYGTRRNDIEQILKSGKHAMLAIDVKGCHSIKTKIQGSVSIFILPPSLLALWERLERRATDSLQSRLRRIENASKEIEAAKDFDHFIVNESFEEAYKNLKSIVIDGGKSSVTREEALKLTDKLLKEYHNASWLKDVRKTG